MVSQNATRPFGPGTICQAKENPCQVKYVAILYLLHARPTFSVRAWSWTCVLVVDLASRALLQMAFMQIVVIFIKLPTISTAEHKTRRTGTYV